VIVLWGDESEWWCKDNIQGELERKAFVDEPGQTTCLTVYIYLGCPASAADGYMQTIGKMQWRDKQCSNAKMKVA